MSAIYRLATALGVERSDLLPDPPTDADVSIAIGDASDSSRASLASFLHTIEKGPRPHDTQARRKDQG